MTGKEFLLAMPKLCGASEPERWSRVIELQLEDEKENPGSVFAKNTCDTISSYNRVRTAFGFDGNPQKIQLCKILVQIMNCRHEEIYHKELWTTRLSELEKQGKELEVLEPEIFDAMSVSQAMGNGEWNG